MVAPSLAIAVLSGALIAGDPDIEWSESAPGSGTAPAVSPAPPPPRVVARSEAPPLVAATPKREALDKSFRIAVELDVGVSPASLGKLGVGLELDFYLLRYVRLHAALGSAWVAMSNYGQVSNHGAVKLLGG